MRIGIIGGLDRNARDLEAVAEAGGHQLETHTGTIGGSSSAAGLRALVARVDLVFVLTDVNSHNAVHLARKTARLHHVPLRIVRRLGSTHLAAYLKGLSQQGGRADPGDARHQASTVRRSGLDKLHLHGQLRLL